MYIDGTITTEFTGYYDDTEEEYVYPSAPQDFAIRLASGPTLYAQDGDFIADSISIMSETGDGDDITIGNATSKVLSATTLNPAGLMDGLTWGVGTAYVGVVTYESETAVDDDVILYAAYGGLIAWATEGGMAYATYNGTTASAQLVGTPGGMFMTTNGVTVYTDQYDYYIAKGGAAWSQETQSTSWDDTKYRNSDTAYILYESTYPVMRRSKVSGGTVTNLLYRYVPMGVFDFSNVDAHGITFQVEAYDLMTEFDADATDWVNSLTFPMTISGLVSALMTEMGYSSSYTIPTGAVNTALSIPKNPVTSYSVTYRQILKWLAEVMGCNVRMSRAGAVEFYQFGSASVATVTPNTIISNSRTKYRYTVPQITKAVCYNTLGAGYESGVDGSTYYFVGNPFLDPSADITPLSNLLGVLDDIPAYYPTTISVACADPRIDVGDLLTVQSADGSTTYNVPIMRQTFHWANMGTAELTATGNQVRSIPESMENTDLSSMVDSNPSAVIQKIEAVGISADWITTGKLTVLDANDNVLFEADKDTNAVQIGGFTVDATRLVGRGTYDSNGVTHTIQSLLNNTALAIADTWGSAGHENIVINKGGISIESGDASGNYDMVSTDILGGGATFTSKTALAARRGVVDISSSGGGSIEVGPAGDEMTYINPMLQLSAGQSGVSSSLTANTLSITDGTNTVTLSPTALNFSGDNAGSFRMWRMTVSSTAETTQTLTLPYGTYLIFHSRYTTPSANSTGLQLAIIGQTAATTPIISDIVAGSHITATSGTRSQVSISVTSSESDATARTATLTWTTSGLAHRRLVIVRLY